MEDLRARYHSHTERQAREKGATGSPEDPGLTLLHTHRDGWAQESSPARDATGTVASVARVTNSEPKGTHRRITFI
ncbi:hypothetical protein NDU88_001959 [Pleurodeles waltl]|uniref:Uncharacterized protein n=1 Tax=Pleurodeles waltl TaxID=8319 RepID=A0AAV7WK15_PLEWA|nr:hypothetical protein NDU88_001959 [Pleurodeles waltl]